MVSSFFCTLFSWIPKRELADKSLSLSGTCSLPDFSNKCEGGCWEFGGSSELVGCLGSFLYLQLFYELECFR